MPALHRSDFLALAKRAFPQLREDLNKQYGLLHLEMHAFCDFVQRAIDSHDTATVTKAFQLSEELLQGGNSDLVNAITVSMLEHLNFEDGKTARAWARALMPANLAAQHRAIIEYNRKRRTHSLRKAPRKSADDRGRR
jgi:hypothetical protein